MGVKTEDIIEEVTKNIRADREKIKVVRDKLVNIVSSPQLDAMNPAGDDSSSLGMIGVVDLAESIAKISAVMSTQNAQLIELSKVTAKNYDPEKDASVDKNSMFDEIEKSKSQDDDDVTQN